MLLIKYLYDNIYKTFTHDFNRDLLITTYDTIPDYAKSVNINMKACKCYKFRWDSTDVELTFYNKNSVKPKDAIALICFYLSILNLYLKKNNKILRIILAPFDRPKLLPTKMGLPLNPEYVNSGYSTGHHIYIYRKEEMYKVLIHEMIHYYDIDFKDTRYDGYFKKKYNIRSSKSELRVFESYTDILAIMFSILAYICFSPFSKGKTEKQFTELYMRILDSIKTNVIQTVSNIMNHYNCTSFCGFEEETHVFSYYVCKAAIMFKYKDFLNWLGNDIILSDIRVKEYLESLDSYISNEDFQDEVKYQLQMPRNKGGESLRMFKYHLKGM